MLAQPCKLRCSVHIVSGGHQEEKALFDYALIIEQAGTDREARAHRESLKRELDGVEEELKEIERILEMVSVHWDLDEGGHECNCC